MHIEICNSHIMEYYVVIQRNKQLTCYIIHETQKYAILKLEIRHHILYGVNISMGYFEKIDQFCSSTTGKIGGNKAKLLLRVQLKPAQKITSL